MHHLFAGQLVVVPPADIVRGSGRRRPRHRGPFELSEYQVIDTSELFACLQQGDCLITGNRRLARMLQQEYDLSQQDSGAWLTPDIIPWQDWLLRSWQEAVLHGYIRSPGLLLSLEQERQIWQRIIKHSETGGGLLRTAATARQVQEAWWLVHAWDLDYRSAAFSEDPDSAALASWAQEFEQLCGRHGWLSQALLPAQLLSALRRGDYRIDAGLMLLGVARENPQQREIRAAILAAGGDYRLVLAPAVGGQAWRLGCDDGQSEIRQAALWARARLEAEPRARIGIVVPGLSTRYDAIIHTLEQVLTPRRLQPGAGRVARPWNISLGRPLSEYALPHSALTLLEGLAGELALEQAGRMLRSPFLEGWEEEDAARALLDRRLREDRQTETSWSRICHLAMQEQQPWSSPRLAAALQHLRERLRQLPRRATLEQWSGHFDRLLDCLGWSRGRSLDSEEFQLLEAWHKLLKQLATLTAVLAPMDMRQALALLRSLAAERLFQPQSDPAQLQVLGLYEAIGLQFDHLWVLGLDDVAWPPRATPHPFLPLKLQRATGMPHASAELELDHACLHTRALRDSAREAVMSYPRQGEHAEALGPSPLIEDLEELGVEQLALWSGLDWAQAQIQAGEKVGLCADRAPPYQGVQVRGGSGLFRAQALCPFKAFAEIRLGALPLAQAEPGLDALSRGNLIHRSLEIAWGMLGDQEQLHAQIADGVLAQTLKEASSRALDEFGHGPGMGMSGRLRTLEQERICRLLQAWLDIEAQREPFRVIAREAPFPLEIGGIETRLKVDRIDQLDDGSKVLIDYKTGQVNPTEWFDERPEEPQLPLYSMLVEGDKSAVLIAQIRTGDCAFKGVVARAGLIPGLPQRTGLMREVTEHWPEVFGQWAGIMTALARDFRAGRAEVDPKDPVKTCQYCELGGLCRIDEQTALSGRVPLVEDNG